MSDLKNEWIHLLANYGHVGFTFVAAIFIGLGGGILLDQKVFDGRTAPWFTFIGLAFGIGAAMASLTFFTALGFGARALAPVFARPSSWVVLEVAVGCVMWAIAAGLAFGMQT